MSENSSGIKEQDLSSPQSTLYWPSYDFYPIIRHMCVHKSRIMALLLALFPSNLSILIVHESKFFDAYCNTGMPGMIWNSLRLCVHPTPSRSCICTTTKQCTRSVASILRQPACVSAAVPRVFRKYFHITYSNPLFR